MIVRRSNFQSKFKYGHRKEHRNERIQEIVF